MRRLHCVCHAAARSLPRHPPQVPSQFLGLQIIGPRPRAASVRSLPYPHQPREALQQRARQRHPHASAAVPRAPIFRRVRPARVQSRSQLAEREYSVDSFRARPSRSVVRLGAAKPVQNYRGRGVGAAGTSSAAHVGERGGDGYSECTRSRDWGGGARGGREVSARGDAA